MAYLHKKTQISKYLDPAVVSRLGNMELKARLIVEGYIAGLHRSPYHGFSVEFAEYRQYMQGDNAKTIDWKVFGKTDRTYVKLFEEETNLIGTILLDKSGSMGFPSDEEARERLSNPLGSRPGCRQGDSGDQQRRGDQGSVTNPHLTIHRPT